MQPLSEKELFAKIATPRHKTYFTSTHNLSCYGEDDVKQTIESCLSEIDNLQTLKINGKQLDILHNIFKKYFGEPLVRSHFHGSTSGVKE